jgi:5-methylcytosine-specific restriction protein A
MAWSRESRHARGYDHRWDKLRKTILTRDKHLCQPCLAKGRVTAANQVDHITPKAKGGTDHEDNLRAICQPCHADKTTQDSGGRVKQAIGADGWPID